MKIARIMNRWSSVFCLRHAWRQTAGEEGGRLHYSCGKCGRKKTESRRQELYILLPEQFAAEMPENIQPQRKLCR